MIKHSLLISCVVLAAFGCDQSNSESPPSTITSRSVKHKAPEPFEKTQPASITDLDAVIARSGSVTFLSWNGTWIGTDCDNDLTFFANGRVHMFEYRDAMTGYEGTYSMDAGGSIIVQFPGFPVGWPEMVARKESSRLVLYPKDPTTGFVMGGGGGATLTGGGSFWPFGQLNSEEGTMVRQRIEVEKQRAEEFKKQNKNE